MIVTDKLWVLYESISPFHAALATSLLLIYFIYLFLKDNDLPPGPVGIPVFGYYPFLNAQTCHIQLKNMVEKYGDVFSLRVCGKLFIHLGSTKAIKEAHVTKSECFGERVSEYSVLAEFSNEGVIVASGERWQVLRKFFLTKFKEYGMNTVKENITGSFHDALKETVEELHNLKGQPIAITDLCTAKCMNLLRRILFNDQGITTEELDEMVKNYKILATTLNSTTFLLYGNLAKYLILPLMPSSRRRLSSSKRIDEILMGVVNRHKRLYDETQVVDIIDCFIKERDDRRKKGDPAAEYLTDQALVGTLNQIITDGVMTVGLFIGTLLMTLVEHPKEQDIIYEELMDVVGPERMPSIEDKAKLPRTNAFINEVIRFTDFFPLFPSQQCRKETTLQGHKIPKGAITLVNIYGAHRNPNTYEDPETFNPSRFLATADKKKAELPVLFGVGKRACIGESFTMLQAFLFFTTIVKNFRLSFPEGAKSLATMFYSEEKLLIHAIPRSQKVQS